MPTWTIRSVLGDYRRRIGHREWSLPDPRPLRGFDTSSDALSMYRSLEGALRANRAGPVLVEAFAALGADDGTSQRVEGLVDRLSDDRTAAVLALYAEATRLDSSEDALLAYLGRYLTERLEQLDTEPESRGHGHAWQVGYFLDAALTGFERTGTEAFIDVAADALDHMLERRDDVTGTIDTVRGRVVPSWGGGDLSPGDHTVNVTLTGRIAHQLARFAGLAAGSGLHEGRVSRYSQSALESVGAFDDEYRVEPDGAGWYPVPGTDRVEPLNHLAAMGAALLGVHGVTGDDGALERATGIARFIRSSWYPDRSGATVWDYAPDPESRRGIGIEYVWKAQVTASFVHMAALRSVEFGPADLAALSSTFETNVFRPRGVSATIYDRFTPLEPFGDYRGGYQSLLPLVALHSGCPGLADAVEDMVAAVPQAGGWLHRPQGAVGYAARL